MRVEENGDLSLRRSDLIDPKGEVPAALTGRHFGHGARIAGWYARQIKGCRVTFVIPGRLEVLDTSTWPDR